MAFVKPIYEKKAELLPLHIYMVSTHHPQKPCDRPNGAPIHQVLFIKEGEAVFEAPDRTVTLCANTAVFMKKGYPMRYRAKGEQVITAWVSFDGIAAEGLLDYFEAEPFSYCSLPTIYDRIRTCFWLCHHFAQPETVSGAVYDLILTYFSAYNASACPPSLSLAKQYVEENFCRDISVNDIAHAAGISPSLLHRLFKEKEHTTPIAFLRSVRIRHAGIFLLSEEAPPIYEVARRCGFSDTAYFCKVFRAETGKKPSAFRHSHA